jgi:hypothetical protein
MVYKNAGIYTTILKGQYDLIGVDPRGVNMSSVSDSCRFSEVIRF